MRTIVLKSKPHIKSFASIVGKIEGQGPLKNSFDFVMKDALYNQQTWEKAEKEMYKYVVSTAASKANINIENIDLMIGGDLLNQIISASFAARDLEICFLGQYGACSTMAQSLLVGSLMVDGGFYDNVACCASSHFATAERQYRFPLELGCQRPPTAQRTVTGAGCSIVSKTGINIRIEAVTVGKIIDWKIDDVNNMGAAMAPSAADTIMCHLTNRNKNANDYDLIITGDLGYFGKELCKTIMLSEYNIQLGDNFTDCGCEIFTKDMDVDSGGSGCGCSASVLNGHIFKKMLDKTYKRVLFLSTGALLSLVTSGQGETIPGIAHAIEFVCEE